VDELKPPANIVPADPSAYSLFTTTQVNVAAFVGGPVAAGWLMTKNFRVVSKDTDARRTALVFSAFFAGVVIAALVLPTEFPNQGIPLVTIGLAQFWYWKYQKVLFTQHIDNGGRKASNWSVAGVSITGAVAFVVCAIVVGMTTPLRPWNHVSFGTNVVFYEGNADRDNAASLGQYLEDIGVFQDDFHSEITLEFPKSNSKMVLIKGAWIVPEEGTDDYEDLQELVDLLNDRYYGRVVVLEIQNAFGITVSRINSRLTNE